MWHPIIINAFAAGILIAGVAAPLGCFLVWKRISSFSDAVSHIALPGIAIGVVMGISSFLCSATVIFLTAAAVSMIKERSRTSANSLLVALTQIGMGSSYLILSLFKRGNGFTTLLFGDILSIDTADIAIIASVCFFAAVSLFLIKDKLLLAILCEDIAVTEGINVRKMNLFFMFILSLTVAVSIKTAGVLLVSSLLIIPPVIARLVANNYRQMLFFSSFAGMAAVAGGIFMSFAIDVPPIAAVVSIMGVTAVVIFFIQFVIKCFKKVS